MSKLSMSDHIQIGFGDPAYPASLLGVMGGKAPKMLRLIGNMNLLTRPGVGFCGSRKASKQGLAVARDCASQAADLGINVISGNAAGVDFEAHHQALLSGGSTILVLPEGIEHFKVRKTLKEVWDWDRVLIISQFEPQHVWQTFRAMERNKVIIGLSGAMIVIEAGDRGGTLDAGKASLEMGIPLFVAQYESIATEARGNGILLKMGGIPLNRLRSTSRANMARVRDAIERPNDSRLQPKLL